MKNSNNVIGSRTSHCLRENDKWLKIEAKQRAKKKLYNPQMECFSAFRDTRRRMIKDNFSFIVGTEVPVIRDTFISASADDLVMFVDKTTANTLKKFECK